MEQRHGHAETFGHRYERTHPGRSLDAPAEPAPLTPFPAGIEPPGWLGDAFMMGALYVLAGLVGGLGVLGGLYALSQAASRGVEAGDLLLVFGLILAGVAVGGLLVATGLILSLAARQRQQVRQIHEGLAGVCDGLARLGQATADRQALAELADQVARLEAGLAEVAHNSLLDEAGRTDKRRQLTQQQREASVEQIRREMAEGQWDRARVAIERFRANYGSQDEQAALASRLADELDRRREQAEAEDVAAARRQCDELLSVSSADRALGVAQELVAKHPESTSAKSLLARVDRERKVAHEQQRQGLYATIQRHTSRREWKDAFQSAQRLIAQFPDSIEAEAVKAQMETLAANAEIQHRQVMEGEIKDLVKRQRFEEAVQRAEGLIAAYPHSPQASALREQLPRLKEMAEQSAREARKRRVQWQ